MNLNNTGWLQKYLDYRKDFSLSKKQLELYNDIEKASKVEQFLYQFIQPTGLIYGSPIQFPDLYDPQLKNIDAKDRMKLILIEGFINSGLVLHNNDTEKKLEMHDIINDIIIHLGEFYSYIDPEQAKKSKSLFSSKKRHDLELTEYLLSKHINIKSNLENFWTSFFENSLTFLDIIYFTFWMQAGRNKDDKKIINARENIHIVILKTIAAAAYADEVIQKEEKKLFEAFFYSAQLNPDKKKEIKNNLNKGITLNEIDYSGIESWILKKYILELAILTIWSNKNVDASEIEFVNTLSKKLGIKLEELENSMMAIESFVVQNWDSVHFLQHKQDFKIVSNRFKNRVSEVLLKNKQRIVKEMQESKELMSLLAKSSHQKLTPEEKHKVKTQLLDILKTIPSIAIFLMPLGTLILPILLKVLPKNLLFPSAFINEQ